MKVSIWPLPLEKKKLFWESPLSLITQLPGSQKLGVSIKSIKKIYWKGGRCRITHTCTVTCTNTHTGRAVIGNLAPEAKVHR